VCRQIASPAQHWHFPIQWGAGNVGDEKHHKHFSRSEFTLSSEDFGLKHFPSDDRNFFRAGGRVPTWGEYMFGPSRGEPLQLFSNLEDHGLSARSFTLSQERDNPFPIQQDLRTLGPREERQGKTVLYDYQDPRG
jgi:hypothetical protein